MNTTAEQNKPPEPSHTVNESDTETEFYDACDSLEPKLHSLSEQTDNKPTGDQYDEDDNDHDDEEEVVVDEDSGDSDFESQKTDMLKKFDEKFKLKSDETTKSDPPNKVTICNQIFKKYKFLNDTYL